MTTGSTNKPLSVVRRRAALKAKYFHMTRADDLDTRLTDMVDDFDAGKLSGEPFEGSGLVVVGESGTGKTTEIDHALKRLGTCRPLLECGLETRYLQHTLEAESTWKALGLQLLDQLGYKMTAKRTEYEIWARVRSQMKGQGIWLLHIDECQHMFQTLGERETRKVVNAIKTFMKHREWPMALVLSGIPELMNKVNLDPQFRNLMTPVAMRALDPQSDDLDEIDTAFYEMARFVGTDIDDVRDEDTYLRMAYGHQDMFGRIFRFMVDAFASLPAGESKLTMAHLADRYARKTGCLPGQNVFLREDYLACNVAVLMADK